MLPILGKELTPEQQAAHDQLLALVAEHDKNSDGSDAVDSGGISDDEINVTGNPELGPTAYPAEPATAAAAPVPVPMAAPKPDLGAPLGYREPAAKPRDTELETAQADAKSRRNMAGLGQAVTDFTERPNQLANYAMRLGGGGAPTPTAKSDMWQRYAAEGDQNIKNLMERRKSEAGMVAAQSAAQKAAEDKDPNSSQAQFVRDFIYSQAPQLKGQLDGKSVKDMSVAFPWIPKVIDENGETIKAQAASDARSHEIKRKEEAATKELEAEKAAMILDYPDKADEIKSLKSSDALKQFSSRNEGRLGRAQSADNARTAAGVVRANKLTDVKEERGIKAEESAASQAIPGYKHDKSVKVAPDDVKAIRDANAEGATMNNLIDELDGLIDKNGIKLVPDAEKARMQAIQKQLALKAKGPAFAQLGVLSGPDLEILEQLSGDPTDWKSFFKGGAPAIRERLKVFKETLKSGLENKTQSRGYSPEGTAATKPKTVKLNGKTYIETGDPAHPLEEAD